MRAIENRPDKVASGRQRALLTMFAVNNRDLDRLEAHLREFNIFEAIGVSRQELRHSDFLSFLLDPAKPHGMGSLFARRLLQRAVSADEDVAGVTALDLELMSLDGLQVRREWNSIDLLLVHAGLQLAVTIENKVGTSEHSSQLQRYVDIVEREFQGFRQVFVYLTPQGAPASDERYVVLSYAAIAEILSAMFEDQPTGLNPTVVALASHYVRMLRRHVVSDSEIAELCRKIYDTHREALDLIFEHRPAPTTPNLSDFLVELVESTPPLIPEVSSPTYIRFLVPEFDTPALEGAGVKRWAPNNRILFFEIENGTGQLLIKLMVGPGEDNLRRVLIEGVSESGGPFATVRPSLWEKRKYNVIFKHHVLSHDETQPMEQEDMEARFLGHWDQFLANELPEIIEGLREPIRKVKDMARDSSAKGLSESEEAI